MEEATNRDYTDSDPKGLSFRDAAILATWIILWICAGFGFILLTAPVIV